MQEVLEYENSEETRRRKEMELLFLKEAAKMWKKQEDVWDREDRARKRLMEEVSDAWNKQYGPVKNQLRMLRSWQRRRKIKSRPEYRNLNNSSSKMKQKR